MLRRVAVSAAARTQLRRSLSSSATAPVIKPLGYVAHRSDAQDRIARVDVIEVDSDVALCDGGRCTASYAPPVPCFTFRFPWQAAARQVILLSTFS